LPLIVECVISSLAKFEIPPPLAVIPVEELFLTVHPPKASVPSKFAIPPPPPAKLSSTTTSASVVRAPRLSRPPPEGSTGEAGSTLPLRKVRPASVTVTPVWTWSTRSTAPPSMTVSSGPAPTTVRSFRTSRSPVALALSPGAPVSTMVPGGTRMVSPGAATLMSERSCPGAPLSPKSVTTRVEAPAGIANRQDTSETPLRNRTRL
jgi:hypothetical protein